MKSELVIQILLLLLSLEVLAVVEADVGPIARRGCNDACGGVKIPYPFGIGKGCFLDPWFEIECTTTNNGSKPKPMLHKLKNIELMEVFLDSENAYFSPALIVAIPPMNVCVAETPQQRNTGVNLTGSPHTFSVNDNVFVVEGCSGNAVLRDHDTRVMAGCGTVCRGNTTTATKNRCYGVQCCKTPLSPSRSSYYNGFGLMFYHIDVYLLDSSDRQSCIVATLIESDSANGYAGKLSSSSDPSSAAAPVVLLWSWTSPRPADADSNAVCSRDQSDTLHCGCYGNYYGNAYVSNGCQVPDACKGCRGYCDTKYNDSNRVTIPNSYYCDKKPLTLATILGLSIRFGIVLLVIGLYGLYRFVKRRREIRRRARFFKRNGGLLLHQQLSSNEGVIEGTKIFTISELEKATDHFNENRILGQGGQGTVYKGMLVDGRIVAIKKAKLLDESQLEQFINELVILSQINHRNVVKVLGCCLETEVPLLVYDYVPNGTLFQYIHDPDEEFVITWEMRLKIVLDLAGAIAYLHSSSSVPIYYRDIKSSNILLDEKHRAKVSDFGSSKTIALEQTHLTTLVQGTMGYLDPEYFQSYQFTEKSDVYSFGVVLLELLTSKKPIYQDGNSMEQKNLVTEFLSLCENSRLSEILDPEIISEVKEDEVMVVVDLAKRCTSWSGKLRPTMKEVAMTLEMVIKSPAQVSTWYKQQEAVRSQVVGFAENGITEEHGGVEFMSNPLPPVVMSPLHIDMNPLVPYTI